MKYDKYKFFWKANDFGKDILLVFWDEKTRDYYSFTKECIDNGLHQISLTAEIMLGFITSITATKNIVIEKIELMEEDSEENSEINELVELSKSNRGMFVEILNRLRYLEDESSIEIKRVYFKEKIDGQKSELFYMQVNGLIGATSRELTSINMLEEYVKETING